MSLNERMAKAFATLDDDGRRFWLAVVEAEARHVEEARRPALRLISGGNAGPNPAPASCATVQHNKIKELA